MTDWPQQRVLPPEPDCLTDRQREVREAIVSGRRGGVRGPLAVWLRRPELAATAQALGHYCRYETLLEPRLSELAILATAQVWGSHYEWFAHKKIALQVGLAPSVVEAIRAGDMPQFERADEQVVYEFAIVTHRERSVPDPLFRRAVAELGEDGVVDLVGLLGYYSLISMTINVFNVSPPADAPKELP